MMQHRNTSPAQSRGSVLIVALYALALAGFETATAIADRFSLQSRTVTVPYRILYLALALAVLLQTARRHRAFLSRNIWYLVFALWSLLGARLIFDLSINKVFTQIPASDYWMMVPGHVVIPMLAFAALPNARTLSLAKTWGILLLTVAGLALMYLFTFKAIGLMERGQFVTNTLNPISIGHMGVSLSILAVFTLLSERGNRSKKLLYMVPLALGVILTLGSGSRGPQAAWLICLLTFIVLRVRKLNYSVLLCVAIISIWLTPKLIDYLDNGTPIKVFARWSELNDPEQSQSAGGRIAYVREAWGGFISQPLSGSNMVVEGGSYPHNFILESLMATGLLGGLLLLVFIAVCSRAAYSLFRGGSPHAWVALLYLQYLTSSMFSGSLYLSATFWFWSIAVLATDRAGRTAHWPRMSQLVPHAVPTHLHAVPVHFVRVAAPRVESQVPIARPE
jgi:hypothetical protein